jgi:hypothetical protein
MGVFSNAPVYKHPAPPNKKGRRKWSIYAQRAKQRKTVRVLIEENTRLRAENETLKLKAWRLQQENDSMWQYIGVIEGDRDVGDS